MLLDKNQQSDSEFFYINGDVVTAPSNARTRYHIGGYFYELHNCHTCSYLGTILEKIQPM